MYEVTTMSFWKVNYRITLEYFNQFSKFFNRFSEINYKIIWPFLARFSKILFVYENVCPQESLLSAHQARLSRKWTSTRVCPFCADFRFFFVHVRVIEIGCAIISCSILLGKCLFAKISFFLFERTISPVIMLSWLQLMNQVDFLWRHTNVVTQN